MLVQLIVQRATSNALLVYRPFPIAVPQPQSSQWERGEVDMFDFFGKLSCDKGRRSSPTNSSHSAREFNRIAVEHG